MKIHRSRRAVLYGSDTVALLVLRGGVADGPAEGMCEVGLVGVQVEVVSPEGLLDTQNLEQIVRREIGQVSECALQLPGRQSDQRRHVRHRPDCVSVREDAGCDGARSDVAVCHAPADVFRQHGHHVGEIETHQPPTSLHQR